MSQFARLKFDEPEIDPAGIVPGIVCEKAGDRIGRFDRGRLQRRRRDAGRQADTAALRRSNDAGMYMDSP